MKIRYEKFGITKNNEEVINYTIEAQNMRVEILNYGCTIKSIYTPDKQGNLENIALGFDSLEDYEKENTPYLGCIVGRTAGRTKEGFLKIGDKKYQLSKNNGNNNLHGGINGLHRKVWESYAVLADNKAVLTFKITSPHMEEGFPGTVEFTIRYTIDENSITIEYLGIPDRETYMNLTNHTYFNLSGNSKTDILQQEIKLNATGYYAVDQETLPLKLIKEDEIFNPNENICLGKVLETSNNQIEIAGGGYDHPFLLSKTEKVDGYAVDKKSGRKLEFTTDQPVVVFYTGNYLGESTNYPKHGGFCLETQDYPDIVNLFPENMKIYSQKNIYSQKTTYIFSVE